MKNVKFAQHYLHELNRNLPGKQKQILPASCFKPDKRQRHLGAALQFQQDNHDKKGTKHVPFPKYWQEIKKMKIQKLFSVNVIDFYIMDNN